MLFAMKSHSLETSSGGNSIWSVETDPGCVSTSTFMNALTVAALDERRKILSAKHAKIHGEESQVHDAKNWWQGTAGGGALRVKLLFTESSELRKNTPPSSILFHKN